MSDSPEIDGGASDHAVAPQPRSNPGRGSRSRSRSSGKFAHRAVSESLDGVAVDADPLLLRKRAAELANRARDLAREARRIAVMSPSRAHSLVESAAETDREAQAMLWLLLTGEDAPPPQA